MELVSLKLWMPDGTCKDKPVCKVNSPDDIHVDQLEKLDLQSEEDDLDERAHIEGSQLFKAYVEIDGRKTSVSIKICHVFHDEEQNAVDEQYRILRTQFEVASKCKGHPNILQLLGCYLVHRSSSYCVCYLIYEYPTHGALLQHIENIKSDDAKWEIAEGLIAAIQVVHSKGYVHQRLDFANIMVSMIHFCICFDDFAVDELTRFWED
jgi:serine/threonine protein kinase